MIRVAETTFPPRSRRRLRSRDRHRESVPRQRGSRRNDFVFRTFQRRAVVNFFRAARADDDGAGNHRQFAAVGKGQFVIARHVPAAPVRDAERKLVFDRSRIRQRRA